MKALYWCGLILGWQFFTGIGIPPLPEEVTIFWAGTLPHLSEDVKWWFAYPACVVGIVAADLVLYGTGRLWGRRLFQYRWVKRLLPPDKQKHIEEGFHKHGVKIMITGRVIPLPGIRTGVFLTAGMIHFPFYRFLVADIVFGVLGVGIFFFGSYFLTEAFIRLYEQVHAVAFWIVLPVVLAVGGYLLYRYLHALREQVAAQDFAPPTLQELIHPHESHLGLNSQPNPPKVETPVQKPDGTAPEPENARRADAATLADTPR